MNGQATEPRELSCEQCRELLSDYVDKELAGEDLAAVEHHVATCEKCATESTRVRGLKNIAQHWQGVAPDKKFHDSVMERYITESQMMASKPFKEAADSQREAQRNAEGEAAEKPKGLPVALVLGIAVALAAIAFVALKFLR